MHLLVLAPEPVDADLVHAAVDEDLTKDSRVLVVSPALNDSPLAFWVSDSDEAIAEAKEAESETAEDLRDDGVQARGTTGESQPLLALQDALATFPADRILIFVRPDDEQSYNEDDVCGAAQERFDVPVTMKTLAPSS